MTAKLTLVIDAATEDVKAFRRIFDRSNKQKSITNVMTYLRGVLGGIKRARIHANVATAQSSGTVTFASVSADDTVTVGGVAFTAKVSPSGSAQFAIGSSVTAAMTNLVAKINAHATAQKLVAATSSAAVGTIRSIFPGPIGDLITLAKSGAGISVSGATLSGGDADEVDTYNFGHH